MTTLTDIVGGIGVQCQALDPRLNWFPQPPAIWDAPAVFVSPPVIDYRLAMRAGVIGIELEVVFLVGAFDAGYQADLLPYVDWTGPMSLRARLDAHRDLGLGDGVDCVAMSGRPLGIEEIGSYQGWGAAVLLQAAFTNNQG